MSRARHFSESHPHFAGEHRPSPRSSQEHFLPLSRSQSQPIKHQRRRSLRRRGPSSSSLLEPLSSLGNFIIGGKGEGQWEDERNHNIENECTRSLICGSTARAQINSLNIKCIIKNVTRTQPEASGVGQKEEHWEMTPR